MASKIFPHIPKLEAYIWPGGYPLFYIVVEGRDETIMCPECATDTKREYHADGEHRAITILQDANWEDPDLHCEACGRRIESAYAEDKVPKICAESGYTDCACRDCMEIAIGDKGAYQPFCHECEAAGCELDEECKVERLDEDDLTEEGSEA